MRLSDLKRILETAFYNHYAVKAQRSSIDEIRIVSVVPWDDGHAVTVKFPSGIQYAYRIDGGRIDGERISVR